MKLESFKDKKSTKRKMILLSLGIITIVGVSLLLYKTFASFSKEVSFRVMSGKVNYYGNSDIIFAFYKGEQELDEMPQKGNPDNLVFEKAVCDNGASIEWDSANWAPLVVNLTTTKTRCTLYFNKKTGVQFLEEKAQEEQTKEEPELMYDDTEDKNLRYVGASPNNYINIGDNKFKHDIYKFVDRWLDDDNEYNSLEECENAHSDYGGGECQLLHQKGEQILWRIIGVMKNVTNVEIGKQENLIKIIRADSIGNYSWDTSEEEVNAGNGVNEWNQADLMKLLNSNFDNNQDNICKYGECSTGYVNNSLYWNNESGQCYISSKSGGHSCDFTSKGISEEAKNKIVKVRWNTGTFATDDESEWTASATYKAERSEINGKQYCINKGCGSTFVCNSCNDEVERTTTWDGYIGLMAPSDFGYAIGKSVRNMCLSKSMSDYGNECDDADWLISDNYELTLNPVSSTGAASMVFELRNYYLDLSATPTSGSNGVRPVAFLKSNVTFSNGSGSLEDPFIAS